VLPVVKIPPVMAEADEVEGGVGVGFLFITATGLPVFSGQEEFGGEEGGEVVEEAAVPYPHFATLYKYIPFMLY